MANMEKSATDVKRAMVLLANYKAAKNPEGIQGALASLANMKESDFRVAVEEIFGAGGDAN